MFKLKVMDKSVSSCSAISIKPPDIIIIIFYIYSFYSVSFQFGDRLTQKSKITIKIRLTAQPSFMVVRSWVKLRWCWTGRIDHPREQPALLGPPGDDLIALRPSGCHRVPDSTSSFDHDLTPYSLTRWQRCGICVPVTVEYFRIDAHSFYPGRNPRAVRATFKCHYRGAQGDGMHT